MTSDNAPSPFAAVHAAVLSDEYTGKTVENVTRRALIAGNLTRDEAVVRVLSEGSPGLFGLMGAKPARVIIAPKPERPDACVKYFLSKVFALLGLGRTTVNVRLSPSTVDVSVLFTEPSYTDLFARNNGAAYNALYVVLEAFVRRIDRNTQPPRRRLVQNCPDHRQRDRRVRQALHILRQRRPETDGSREG